MKLFLPIVALVSLPVLGAPEIARGLGAEKAAAVASHNGRSLREHLYFSKRDRIVEINFADLRVKGDVQLTLFPGERPVALRVVNPLSEIKNPSDYYQQVRLDLAPRRQADAKTIRDLFPQETGGSRTDEQLLDLAYPPIRLEVHSFDVDAEGNATASSLNLFRHSPYWQIDEFDQPYLREPTDEEKGTGAAIAGPPPETPEEIAYHRRVTGLTKTAFYSVRANFNVRHADGTSSRYSLIPLEYSPRYSVLFEWDESKRLRGSLDYGAPRSAENKERADRYEAFMASLPVQPTGKRVLGEVK